MAYQSEIEKLEQRYRENPQQWFAALADSYRKAGSLDLAIDVVKAGLEQRPNYVSGHIVHGRCLVDQHNDPEAQRVFERVLELDAENVIAIKALAEIGERTGQVEAARRWVNRLLEVDPANEEAQQIIARLGEVAGAAPVAATGEAAGLAGPGAGETALNAVGELLADTAVESRVTSVEPPPARPAPVAGFEATIQEPLPAEPAPLAQDALVLERSEELAIGAEATASGPTVEMEPIRAPGGLGDAVTEPQDLTPALAGPETKEASTVPPVEQPVEAPADLMPFDEGLAWGTGERTSRQITAADVEAAERLHEASLAAPAHVLLPGLESAEIPASEPVTAAEGPAESSQPLPLIFPDDTASVNPVAPPAAEPGPGAFVPTALSTPEPEPVVTETMAELYAQQGLLAEARDTYRQLLAQRPGDAGLKARLAALDDRVKPGLVAPAPAPAQPPRRALVAAETGGPSVRDFLADVFAGGPSGSASAEGLGAAVQPARAAAPAPPPPASQPTLMEIAFEKGEPASGSGEPTRRASDDLSLAAVFGEEPSPPKKAEPPSQPPGSSAAGGSAFSFDEFFGTQRPSRDSAGGGDDDDFKRWLKSLKS
jgi:tetratricopeptide (TPR) repeat protein